MKTITLSAGRARCPECGAVVDLPTVKCDVDAVGHELGTGKPRRVQYTWGTDVKPLVDHIATHEAY